MAGNEELIDYYRDTHARRVYGTSSVKYVRYLRPWIKVLGPSSILDYGCGQSLFLDVLDLAPDVELLRYDPAIPAYSQKPVEPADLLINIDVLEHIEETDIDGVLADMRAACQNAIIVIDTKAAKHTLPDGRNAHVTLHPAEWWGQKLSAVFDYVEPIRTQRRSRAAFKTWQNTPDERLQYLKLRIGEEYRYFTKRLRRQHKNDWKVSSVDRPTSDQDTPTR